MCECLVDLQVAEIPVVEREPDGSRGEERVQQAERLLRPLGIAARCRRPGRPVTRAPPPVAGPPAIPALRLGRRQRQHAERPAARDQRNEDVGTQPERPAGSAAGGRPGDRLEPIRRNLLHQLGASGTEHLRSAFHLLRTGWIALRAIPRPARRRPDWRTRTRRGVPTRRRRRRRSRTSRRAPGRQGAPRSPASSRSRARSRGRRWPRRGRRAGHVRTRAARGRCARCRTAQPARRGWPRAARRGVGRRCRDH